MVKHCMAVLAGLIALATQGALAKDQVTVTDIAGRTVTVHVPVERMILGEGRFLPSLAILDREDPVRWVAGMMADFRRFDPATYAQYRKRFPAIDDIPQIGQSGAESFSLESAIAAKPDVAVFGLSSGHGPGARHKDILDRLAAAGIPVVVIDFRIDPLANTPASMRLLATLMGREQEAEAFLRFHAEQLAVVSSRLKSVRERPSVFMESRVGLGNSCCEAIGEHMIGRFIAWAGGRNLVGELIPGTHGMVNLEFLLVNQPDVYIGTAIGSAVPSGNAGGRIVLGVGADMAGARSSLAEATGRVGINQLEAVKSGRAYAIWHHFYNTPMNVTAVQALAKWLHPDLFHDLSPRRTLESYFERFQPVPLEGIYWVGLEAGESE